MPWLLRHGIVWAGVLLALTPAWLLPRRWRPMLVIVAHDTQVEFRCRSATWIGELVAAARTVRGPGAMRG